MSILVSYEWRTGVQEFRIHLFLCLATQNTFLTDESNFINFVRNMTFFFHEVLSGLIKEQFTSNEILVPISVPMESQVTFQLQQNISGAPQ